MDEQKGADQIPCSLFGDLGKASNKSGLRFRSQQTPSDEEGDLLASFGFSPGQSDPREEEPEAA